MRLSESARRLWAKSDRGREQGAWHPLIAHLLDVAACAEAILEREPPKTLELYAHDLSLEPQQAKAWVCALAGLHDIGKASPAFQQKWLEGKERLWATGLTWSSDPTPPPDDLSHSIISEAVLPELLEARGWKYRAAQNVAAAVGEHHGFRATRGDLDKATTREKGNANWDEVRRELFEAVLEVLGVGEAPKVKLYGGAAFERLAGLTSFADWIGSSLDFHPLGDDLAGYYREAKVRATQKLDGIGWFQRKTLMPEPQSLEEVFAYLGSPEAPFRARPLQAAIERLLEGVDRPALLLVEAPMGEGKTEAAFYAHLRLQAANGHRGMYVALPTQATGNLMFERAKAFLDRWGQSCRLDLQLLHGASELVEAYQEIRVRPNSPEEREEGVEAQIWFSHRKRGLLSEYAVGTVDQALLGILPTKHQFVRLWGLGNRVVVLDEVHAYDTYTSGLIESLVRWLRALDSSVVLMSATLPRAKRENLLRAFGAEKITEDKPYPRITRVVKDNPMPVVETFEARKQPTLRLRALPLGLEAIAEQALEQARRGGCVACIVNTVQRAQELYRALAGNSDGVEVYLFHARYPLEERLNREQLVLDKFGKQGQRPKRAILVATQVVEQSLDLDFDVMFTDLAPVDLVLQRAGRLHRHARSAEERHSHTEPVLWVAGLECEGVPDFGTAERIYERYVLLRSWLALRNRTQIELPGDIDRLVQEVYSDPMPQGLPEAWRRALEEAQARMEKRDARDQDEAFYAPFGDPDETGWLEPRDFTRLPDDEPNPDDDPSLLKTRKGPPSATVVLLHKVGGQLCLDAGGKEGVSLASQLELAQARRIFARSVKLSRYELVQNNLKALEAHRKAHGLPAKPWSETPLLAHAHPVVLEGGCAVLGELVLELHPELGVVYRKQQEVSFAHV
ncbi:MULTISPECIES: CRISPR-associated helicase/endonuclease Cas3 [Meiothermus]|uniref:CRISPR-associated helicase, Cas3 n=1 Tax=Meiothermus taiwanensis WR-220 TaxID=1339250 RepID=A0ABM6WLQ3_9DEIN|nr:MULTISPECIES: CRISPR-associated helicase/endonuclease Cas3 [Meiothermus]AWR87925.1 CRISPR-associated helicase, Cas3 [Meiothermus taiwanensis WR-220]KZK14852.1 CRISPR-associated helicase/endonuclease Cas3 [Meiothermus taiwanensis]GAO76687.1 CRISPR-associated helicase Cas3 [Meiothermus ruber H328]